MTAKKTQAKFIKDSVKKFGDKFKYDLLEYNGDKYKVLLFCKTHGLITITPNRHLAGDFGCSDCGREEGARRKILTNSEFATRAIAIHEHRYSYHLMKYGNARDKIEVVCNVHGSFWISPTNHLSGHGCKKCSNDTTRNTFIKNTKWFIEKAKTIHENLYNYSLVNYIHSEQNVDIICKIHGVFQQHPRRHIVGHGCQKCSVGKNELLILNFLKEKNVNHVYQFKIPRFKNCYWADFYLPETNTIIEYNGAQHYSPVTFGGISETKAQLNLNRQKERDAYVSFYAFQNGINLIEIDGREFTGRKLKNLISKIIDA